MTAAIAALAQPVEADGPAPGAAAADSCANPALDRQLQILARLAEAGLEIAVAIEGRVKAAEPAQPLAELNAAAMAYDRVARAVRLAILLQSRVIRERQEQDEAQRLGRLERRRQRTRSVERIVEWAAGEACGHDREAAGHLLREASERLDTDDIYGDVLSRPVGELVAMICRDLDLPVDWAALADEGWALEEIRSGAAASPFAAKPERMRPVPGHDAAGNTFRRDTG